MTASRIRARLRKARQEKNRQFLRATNPTASPQAFKQFVTFGNGANHQLEFDKFARRFPVGGAPAKRRRFQIIVDVAKALVKKLASGREIKRRRKQQSYRFIRKAVSAKTTTA